MKRKIISVLLTLVLVLSFSLVTAVPAGAVDPATFNVIPFEFQKAGSATAAWSTSAARTGSWGVNIGTDTSGGNYGRVAFAWNQNLSTITNMSYWYNLQAGNGSPNWDAGPYMNIEIDTDNDDVTDAWVLHKMFALSPGTGTWLQWKLSDDPLPAEHMEHDSTDMWHVWDGSSMTDYALWADVLAVHGSHTAIKIKIAVGDWASNIETRHWVDDIAINGTTYYGLIQDAIDSATAAGDTIVAAAGTYTEDLTIPAGKDNLELKPVSGAAVTIKGVATEPDASFPLAVPNIDILSSGVKIHDFTIEGPDAVSGEYASGMLIGASSVQIYDNAFKVTAGRATWAGPVSTGIVTYRKTSVPTVDISGLNIHDNTFTNHGTGAAGFDAIFINIDAGTGTITIADNQFTGNVARAISVERSNVVISGNSIVTDLAPYTASAGGFQGMFIGCFPVGSDPGPVQSNVSITGNTVKGATSSEGFAQGIRVGHTTQLGLTNITVLRNTVQDCDEGITVRADATGVTVNYNDITGNTVGVQNDDAGVELDAKYNWWGDAAGPEITTNPYDAHNAGADSVTTNVDYIPWLIHTELASGWNIWSTPIACGTSTDTIGDALGLWTVEGSGNLSLAYYFDSSASPQAFAEVTSLTPLQAIYIQMSAASTIDVISNTSYTAPPSQTMYAGWNLIGLAELYNMDAEDALASAYYVAGDNNIGYSQVVSPGLGQTAWSATRRATIVGPSHETMAPCEGYWVYMVNQGNLGGFTSTPITELP